MTDTITPNPIIPIGIHQGKKASDVPLDYIKTIVCFHWFRAPHVDPQAVEDLKTYIQTQDPLWEYKRAVSPHALYQTRKIKTKEEQTKGTGKRKKTTAVPEETYEVIPEEEAGPLGGTGKEA